MRRALILGITGQDGHYLTEQLLTAGYDVHGMIRRRTNTDVKLPPGRLHCGDLLDQDSLERVLRAARPDVVFNLAAVTSPGGAWGLPQPPLLAEVTGAGVVRLLEAMVHAAPDAHLVHASSSAIFDSARYGLYGAAKVLAHNAVAGYRPLLYTSNAILYSHTSPRQDGRFLARRICSTVARLAGGSSKERLILGDVSARRDWGWAPDYTRALLMIGEQLQPQDWIVCTGLQHPVRDLVDIALFNSGLTWDAAVTIDPSLPYVADEQLPPADVAHVSELGWKPEAGIEYIIAELLAQP